MYKKYKKKHGSEIQMWTSDPLYYGYEKASAFLTVLSTESKPTATIGSPIGLMRNAKAKSMRAFFVE